MWSLKMSEEHRTSDCSDMDCRECWSPPPTNIGIIVPIQCEVPKKCACGTVIDRSTDFTWCGYGRCVDCCNEICSHRIHHTGNPKAISKSANYEVVFKEAYCAWMLSLLKSTFPATELAMEMDWDTSLDELEEEFKYRYDKLLFPDEPQKPKAPKTTIRTRIISSAEPMTGRKRSAFDANCIKAGLDPEVIKQKISSIIGNDSVGTKVSFDSDDESE